MHRKITAYICLELRTDHVFASVRASTTVSTNQAAIQTQADINKWYGDWHRVVGG